MLHVLRVFCAEDGRGGNHLGVFLDGEVVPEEERQAVANQLGFAETVFVEDATCGALRIFTPTVELPLAGHPLVGTAWLLREQGTEAPSLRPPAGEVGVRFEGEMTFVSANPDWAPPFDFVQVDSPDEVDALAAQPEGYGNVGVWSWLDEDAGRIRERVFAAAEGVPEDEATGAAAMRLVAQLGRPIEIRQGRGSVIYARPIDDNRVEVGGRVALEEVRPYP